MTTVVHFDPEFTERSLCGEADQGLGFLTSCREMVSCVHCEEVAIAREDRAPGAMGRAAARSWR